MKLTINKMLLKLFLIVFSLVGFQIANASVNDSSEDDSLKITSSITNATCDVVVPDSLDFHGHSDRDFVMNSGTAFYLPLYVELQNCKGNPGSQQQAEILVTGETLPDSDNKVFHDSNSESSNSGFMLKSLSYGGLLSDFIDSPGTVASGDYIIVNSHKGERQDDIKLVYTIGYVSPIAAKSGIAPDVGKTFAIMTFKFLYQ